MSNTSFTESPPARTVLGLAALGLIGSLAGCGGALYGGQSGAFRDALTGDPAAIDHYYRGGGHTTETDFSGRTLYHWAAAQGHIDAVRRALDEGVDVDLRLSSKNAVGGVYKKRLADAGLDGATPLYIAAQRGRREVVALLLGRGADPRARAADTSTVLMAAAQSGDPEVARMLLRSGAEVNAASQTGETPLLIAARGPYLVDDSFRLMGVRSRLPDTPHGRDNRDVAAVLIEHGADINAHNRENETPLSRAWKHGQFAVARLLLESGANATAPLPTLSGSPGIVLFSVRQPLVSDLDDLIAIYEQSAERAKLGGRTEEEAVLRRVVEPYRKIHALLKSKISDSGLLIYFGYTEPPGRYCAVGSGLTGKRIGVRSEPPSLQPLVAIETDDPGFVELVDCAPKPLIVPGR
jgi:ankyrin repeat protein